MINIVSIISSRVEKLVRYVKVLRKGRSDVQEIKEIMPFGIDGNPLKDARGLYVSTGTYGKNYIVGYINKNQKSKPGELRLFSLKGNGDESTYIYLQDDGVISMLGDDDNLVKYSNLEIAYNQLKTDHDTLGQLLVTYSAALVSLTGVPAVIFTPSSGDITGAKADNLKTKK